MPKDITDRVKSNTLAKAIEAIELDQEAARSRPHTNSSGRCMDRFGESEPKV